jgi:energy-coupling factor transport system ATP-binding protein
LKGLELDSVKVKAPGGKTILNGISLRVEPGQLVLIAGPSGAGKTTLLRVAAGLSALFNLAVEGRVRVEGQPLSRLAPGLLAYVPQEPWASLLTPYVATELGFLGVGAELARRLGIDAERPTPVLSAGEAQRLAVLAARISGARVLLVDEVTAYLDEKARYDVAKLLREVADEGSAVVVVDHDLGLWKSLVDYVAYLEGGRLTVYEDVLEVPLYMLMERAHKLAMELGREITAYTGSPCLEADRITLSYPGGPRLIRDLTLKLPCPGLVVVKGPSGSGKTSLLKVLAGALKPSRGRIRRRCRRLGYIPENPLLYLAAPTPGDELGWDLELARMFGLDKVLDVPLAALSSGERRRLALASATRSFDCILVDEPTVGLDYASAINVMRALAAAVKRGAGILVATHSSLLASMATHVVEVGT